MTSTAIYKCQCCKQDFVARTADRKRGWARFCSKSCKAIRQEQRTGQFSAYKDRQENGQSFDDDWCHPFSEEAFQGTL
jgi:hypothetical protein